jgi:integrase
MPKRAAGLSAAKVAKEKKPGRYSDGGGLQLFVKPSGTAVWVLRYSAGGTRRDMGLGTARGPGAVTLAEAREKAAALRRMVGAGTDPLEYRRAAEAAAAAAAQAAAARTRTFDEVARLFLEAHERGWRNAKHRAQWAMTLREYAGPHLGRLPVADVETAHVAAALRPLWHDKPETATRLRGRIEAVLDYAAVHGWREGANPARWRGHLDKVFPRRAKVRPVEHHAALPWPELPALMAALRARPAVAARALEFAVLTAARSGEVLGARWSEVDLDGAVWTVPARRMKAAREHRVALSRAAVALLRGLLPLRGASQDPDPLVFPGRQQGRSLSVMAMAMVLRRLERGDLTVHGFRSTFRDWAGETTAHPREVVEAALAHRLGDKVEQAYARGDLFSKRRVLMEDWAAHCTEPQGGAVAFHPAVVDAEAGA